ncbi:MAG: monooxygenase [Myxococcota bacterium]
MTTQTEYFALLALALVLAATACTRPVHDYPYCSDEQTQDTPRVSSAVTWHQDVRPIIEGRCMRCHTEGAIGPFPLETYEDAFRTREAIKTSVVERTMPPWLPASCCNSFLDNFSLTDAQIATVEAWVDQGAPEGDELTPGASLSRVGGLSRVDVTISMAEGYKPEPKPGRVDDFRCFVIDWPLDERKFVTGINPIPGARAILHHLVIGVATGPDARPYEDIESPDGKPGFPCTGGLGDLSVTSIIGGGLAGGDFPEGFGTPVDPDSKIILSVHYSIADAGPEEDFTSIEFKLDDDAQPTNTFVLVNPMWLVDRAMFVPAGDPDVVHQFRYDPAIFTGRRPVRIIGFTPHMHYLGTRVRAAIIRKGTGERVCLAEIPKWDFGWEQPYWFKESVVLQPGDDLYIDCHFDNTQENQPIVGGQRAEPIDVAWGSDNQAMCSGFLNYAPL